jgi:uroporphyrinogen decarboxylase
MQQMTSRERIIEALSFNPTDRVPCDLDAMGSTSISAFAYPKLVKALGLPARPVRIFDSWQMIAVVDMDVLDALGCDCICVIEDVLANVLFDKEKWHPYDFNGRLNALVRDFGTFKVLADGTIEQAATDFSGKTYMPPDAYVFSEEHGGQAVDIFGECIKDDLGVLASELKSKELTPERVQSIAQYCKRAKEAGGDRAVFFRGVSALLGYRGGMANFSMLCMTEPEYVKELHEILIQSAIHNAEALVPAIAPFVDIMTLNSDDQGTQNSTILPPETYRELFVPYYRRLNDKVHDLAPHIKTFYHSCGAIYPIIDAVIDSGFDILNPVQWTAGKNSPEQWKMRADKRLTLWGGGVDTQTVLPSKNISQIEAQAEQMVKTFSRNGGYVFTAIHNIMAEIEPEKVIAMYRAAQKTKCN